MTQKTAKELLGFLRECPTAFHAVEKVKNTLSEHGYEPLEENRTWKICSGGKYFVTRNDSSILAFQIGNTTSDYSFRIAAAHTDYPTFKLKDNALITIREHYTQLNTEGYGGMLCATWFDRPLSIAGRVVVREKGKMTSRLVCIDEDLLLIPSVAIHMNREANSGMAYNQQVDLLPLFCEGVCSKEDFMRLIAKEAGVSPEMIYGTDLYLYNRMAPSIWGKDKEFISSPHLDDMQCGFSCMKGLLEGKPKNWINVMACFDNEEVGSATKQGAASTFLKDVLYRINLSLGKTQEDYYRAVADSFMVSADNAHAVHPNHPEKTDSGNCCYMNHGIVIKSHAGQKYTSDAVSKAAFQAICEEAKVPVQYFANRSDMPGGSTLGNIAMAQVSMNCVDIGLPQLAMHSSYETAGIKDTEYLIRTLKIFYSKE